MENEAEIRIYNHNDSSVFQPIVEIQTWWREPRPFQVFTEEELGRIPKQFRCFMCGDKHDRKCLGGIDHGQYLCRTCYRWNSSWDVGRAILFDCKHGHAPEGYTVGGKPSSSPPAMVCWCGEEVTEAHKQNCPAFEKMLRSAEFYAQQGVIPQGTETYQVEVADTGNTIKLSRQEKKFVKFDWEATM